MITMLASLLGFFSSILPYLIKILRDKYDKAHELIMFREQAKLKQNNSEEKLWRLYLQAQNKERTLLYETYKTDIKLIDIINATVRPVLAYAFFLLYGYIKFTQYYYISQDFSDNYLLLFDLLWSTEDQAIFASIISFYFGQRAIYKIQRH